jgi:hypothetical protein
MLCFSGRWHLLRLDCRVGKGSKEMGKMRDSWGM